MIPAGYTVEEVDEGRWRIVGPEVPPSLSGLLGFLLPADQAQTVAQLLNAERQAGDRAARAEIRDALGLVNSPNGGIVARP